MFDEIGNREHKQWHGRWGGLWSAQRGGGHRGFGGHRHSGPGHYGFEGRGRWHGHGGHGPGGDWGGSHVFPGEGFERWGGPGGFGGRRERMERGLLRFIILDMLRDGPKHGYELMKQVEERTQGRYAPSPGSLYPTLQYLEELGLVTSNEADGRRAYQITDAGRKELDEQNSVVEGFWSRFRESRPRGAARHEVRFLLDALNSLNRTVSEGVRVAMSNGDVSRVRRMRTALERCQNEVREIITGSLPGQAASGEGSEVDNHGDIDPRNLSDEDLM